MESEQAFIIIDGKGTQMPVGHVEKTEDNAMKEHTSRNVSPSEDSLSLLGEIDVGPYCEEDDYSTAIRLLYADLGFDSENPTHQVEMEYIRQCEEIIITAMLNSRSYVEGSYRDVIEDNLVNPSLINSYGSRALRLLDFLKFYGAHGVVGFTENKYMVADIIDAIRSLRIFYQDYTLDIEQHEPKNSPAFISKTQ
jgi:hypothetical protein